ncbi:tetratricopeptide repeat protein [Burkholderia pseudomultivorans]|uniref:tetratricopeptide repeat protein n=1 Tax=Burkholderia pseudomultivorans TaxID=1207504 RepID=UPI0009BEC30C|nr:tetratricopeptide repeat protein [Burkholderia pseudomultivorans]
MNRPLLSVFLTIFLNSVCVTGASASLAAGSATAGTLPAASTVAPTSAQQTAVTLAQHGRTAFKAGNYSLAINYYTAALKLYPLVDAFMGRSLAYSAIHARDESADDAVAAAKIITSTGGNDKFASDLYHLAGLGYYLSDEYDKAIAVYTEAINLAPSNSKIYESRADAYKQKLDFEHALPDLERAMALNPKSVSAKDSYAMAFADMGLYQVAINKLNESLAADKGSSITYMNLGQVYTSMGKYAAARSNLDKALELDPQNWDAVLHNVELNFYMKDYTAASRDADRWLENNRESSSPQDVEYMLIWKHVLSQRLKTDGRASMEEEVSKLRDRGAWPRPIIDFFLSKMNADQLRAAAINGDPDSLKKRQCEAEAYIGEMNLAAGMMNDAARNFEAAVSLCPISWVEYNLSRYELKSINSSVGR